MSEEEFSKTKDLFKNKYLKEKSEKEIREILCIEKIQKMDKKIWSKNCAMYYKGKFDQ